MSWRNSGSHLVLIFYLTNRLNKAWEGNLLKVTRLLLGKICNGIAHLPVVLTCYVWDSSQREWNHVCMCRPCACSWHPGGSPGMRLECGLCSQPASLGPLTLRSDMTQSLPSHSPEVLKRKWEWYLIELLWGLSEVLPVKPWACCLTHDMLTVSFGNHFIAFDITFYYLLLSFSI